MLDTRASQTNNHHYVRIAFPLPAQIHKEANRDRARIWSLALRHWDFGCKAVPGQNGP